MGSLQTATFIRRGPGINSSKNIVVFGETGVGKSSTVNMIMGRNEANVSDSAIGCTFEHSIYPYKDYLVYDTVGLNEATKGTVEKKKAIIKLIKLLKSLKGGINLLIFVIKLGPITDGIYKNYKFFVDIIADNNVPVLLVVTHCEDKRNMNDWWIVNKKHFTAKDMKFTEALCVCASDGEGKEPIMVTMMESKFKASKENLLGLIDKHALKVGWSQRDSVNWLMLIIRRFLINVLNIKTISYLPELKKWLMSYFGLSDEEASNAGNQIFLATPDGEESD